MPIAACLNEMPFPLATAAAKSRDIQIRVGVPPRSFSSLFLTRFREARVGNLTGVRGAEERNGCIDGCRMAEGRARSCR